MGYSMGGLVARYALAYMEDRNINHDTRLYISVDTPHQGANVPVGLQAMFKHFIHLSFNVGALELTPITISLNEIDEINRAAAVFNSPAARQMLKL